MNYSSGRGSKALNAIAFASFGWSGMRTENLPNNAFLVNSVPHAWLFPQVAAVVHHGGAGTTAAGLRLFHFLVIKGFGGNGWQT